MREDYSLKRNISVLLSALMIFIAIIAGGCRALGSAKNHAERVFVYGVNGDGASIASDLAYRSEYAARLSAEAAKYMPEEDALCPAVASAASDLSLAETKSEKYRMNVLLTEKLNALRQWLSSNELPPAGSADAAYINELFTGLESRAQTISHDPYNLYAREYNELISTFPYNLYKKIMRVNELELFGE